jgi:hypothetical protein
VLLYPSWLRVLQAGQALQQASGRQEMLILNRPRAAMPLDLILI